MSLPLTTRFGADPTVDLEVANKRYVDAQGGGGGFIWNAAHHRDGSGGASEFFSFCGGFYVPAATEIDYHAPVANAVTFSRMGIRMSTNTWTVDITVNFRIEGADGNESVNIPSATTGFFQDTVNTDAVTNGQQVDGNFLKPAGSGSTLFDGSTIEGAL